MAKYCDNCKQKISFMDDYEHNGMVLCGRCKEKIEIEELKKETEIQKENSVKFEERREKLYNNFLVVSLPEIKGEKIAKYFSIISSEIVIGTGIFSEFSASIDDLLGVTSTTFNNKIQVAKIQAMKNLIDTAIRMGANAIIGAEIEYTVNKNNMIMYSISGTPVLFKVKEEKHET